MRILFIVITISFAFMLVDAAELSKTMPIQNYKITDSLEPLPKSQAYPNNRDIITDSPGFELGWTYLDYQSNGSTGNRAAVCDDGSIYFCWMGILGWPYPPAPRYVFYYWLSPDGSEYHAGQIGSQGSGHPQLDIIYGDQGAIVFTQPETRVTLWIYPHYYDPPGQYWPHIAVDRNDNIHIISTQFTNGYLFDFAYTRSMDGVNAWTELETIDTVTVIGGVIDASPVSDRVVIAYPKASDTTTQWCNDIVYVVSEDGINWDFENGQINVTDYANDFDSLWAFTDLDVIFDYNDNIHITWNAQWVTDETIYHRTFLFHYNEQTQQINTITAHPDSLWWDNSGVWNRPICKMNLGVQESSNNLYAIWTQFDTSDVSAGGFNNGEIFMSYTSDGSLWEELVNLTDSPTPGCLPGYCDSDNWATLADVVNQSLHITYINDKDAGSILQGEGAVTENSVMYYEYPLETGIDDKPDRPEYISIIQNYPNPFNAVTTIKYNLQQQAFVTVSVYDITGALAAVLQKGHKPAGQHTIIWDASEYPSGIYFANLKVDKKNFTRKMTLLK